MREKEHGEAIPAVEPGGVGADETFAEDEDTARFIAGCRGGRERRSRGNRDGAGREQIIGWEVLDGDQEVGSTWIYAHMR